LVPSNGDGDYGRAGLERQVSDAEMSAFFTVLINASFREDADDLTFPKCTEHGPHCPHIMGASVNRDVVGYLA
jgi:hypothetical protein